MRFILTSRALRCAAPTWSAVSMRHAIRSYASAAVTQVKSSDNDWEGQTSKKYQDQAEKKTQQSIQDSSRSTTFSNSSTTQDYTSWQRRIIELNKPNGIVSEGAKKGILVTGEPYELDSEANLSSGILPHLDRQLYLSEDHPLCITKALVESVFQPPTYKNYHHLNPVVTTRLNFDVLGFPADHPGRSKTDTYYVNKDHVLRTHTSAHEDESFRQIGKDEGRPGQEHQGFTLMADVYRRDSVDRSHYPVFHQMEAAHTWKSPKGDTSSTIAAIKKDLEELGKADIEIEDIPAFTKTNPMQEGRHDPEVVELVTRHLKTSLEHVVVKIITAARMARASSGSTETEEPIKARWIEAYFPFTAPSYELEVWWKGEWLELLGCGLSQQSILDHAGIPDRIGWAFGFGIERLAMLLFGIPDIRLFWSEDPRFLSQFKQGTVTEFKPFSKFPTCFKDVAFWIDRKQPKVKADLPMSSPGTSNVNTGAAAAAPAGGHPSPVSNDAAPPSSEAFHENDLMEIVRDIAGTLVEDVHLVDSFQHPKTGRRSLCYRINYRSLERTLTNEETNTLHTKVLERLSKLDVELR